MYKQLNATEPICNIGNSGLAGLTSYLKCHDFKRVMGKHYQALAEIAYISQPNGWPNVANNDDCIKNIVTSLYWNGSGASALFLSAFAVLTALF